MLANESEAKCDVENLLRRIVAYVNDEPSPNDHLLSKNGIGQETILNLEIDGICYTLMRSQAEPSRVPATLSPREKEVARLVVKGLSNRAIGTVLEISPWTVSTHLRRVFTKLKVRSRAEMVARVLQNQLLGSPE